MASKDASETADKHLLWSPQEIVTVKVQTEKFKVYKSFLTRDSEYFQKALEGSFIEASTLEIDLGDDIECFDFGVYVDILHRSYFVRDLKHLKGDDGLFRPFEELLSLWKCSDRFLNDKLRAIADEAIAHRTDLLTPKYWEAQYQSKTYEGLKNRLIRCHAAAKRCAEEGLPSKTV